MFELNLVLQKISYHLEIQNHILPEQVSDIKKGSMFINLLAMLLPASILAKKACGNNENQNSKYKNIVSFLSGSTTILGLNYLTLKPKSTILI